ncbi:hypothetical protein Cpin_0613 [Chitinophaga pinensis DSM 2588]|uniref:Uncharacterized protein n=1 Tax=Chitinophaga pinensis (strain ATCC 43595 / DSM 2588 / LMG 13176 / NBRC 15968 / NCIMB 11800 / UQM 2034) TaxID=485918 RepID=A0A979FZV7_CHIPD|nr:hypothetical protein Cpin_0613 [Chitinophaga pinensis DSM 2588]
MYKVCQPSPDSTFSPSHCTPITLTSPLSNRPALTAVVSDACADLSPSPASSYSLAKLPCPAKAPLLNHLKSGRQSVQVSETIAEAAFTLPPKTHPLRFIDSLKEINIQSFM